MKLNILTSKSNLRTPLRAPQQKNESWIILNKNSKNDIKKFKSRSFTKN